MKTRFYFAFLIAVSFVSSASRADDSWNQFRGRNGDGIARQSKLPIEFDEARNVRWKVAIPDSGWSSPVVWENEIWLTTGSDQKKDARAICINLQTGEVIKSIKVFEMIERKVDPAYVFDSPHLNSPATPTPVVEEDRVYVSFGSQGIACLDRKSGAKIWERRDLRVYQPVRQGSSPIVDEKNLYVAFDGTDQQFFIAINKTTGATRWKVDRNVETDWRETLSERGLSPKKGGKPNDNKKSFATATLIDAGGRRQLIAPAAEAIISYDPETGDELWRTIHPGGFNVAARPIYANGLVYVFTSGLNHSLIGIRPDGTGNVTDSHIVWSTFKSTPAIPSPVLVDGLLFMVTAKGGIARCLDAKTGQEIWKKRLGGDHWASPILADHKLYFSSKQGEVKVLEATQHEPRLLASNELNAEFIASPAVAGDMLILRSTTHLYCVSAGSHRTEAQIAADIDPKRNAGKPEPAKKKTDDQANSPLAALGAQLKAMVAAGKLTPEEAIELFQSAQGK